MNKKIAIIISPNYKDYARKYLAECAASIRKQDYAGEMKIFITDNESTEESYGYVRSVLSEEKTSLTPPPRQAEGETGLLKGGKMQPPLPPLPERQYEIARNKNNDGFAKGNNDAIKKALEQAFDYVFCLNMDAVLESNCVRKMMEAVNPPDPPLEGGQIGAAQARLMLYDNRNKINSLGNVTHIFGFGYALGYGEEYGGPHPNPRPDIGLAGLLSKEREICYPSGAAVLFTAEVLKKVGLFDEEFWMYNEDQDLGWRIWLAGYRCVLANDAVAYHKYEFSRSLKKYYFMDRNRIMAMLKNYHLLTLILISPAFIVMELGLLFFAARGGWFKEKFKVYKYFLSLKNWRYILKVRKQVQGLRRVKDREIVRLFSGKIWYQEIDSQQLKISNVIFNAYWRVAKVLIRW